MTNGKESGQRRGWLIAALPWIIGIVALGVYVLTINPWVSFLSLPQVAKTSGWVWQSPDYHPGQEFINYPPAYYLATLPIKWLPQAWIPSALNLFSALCAALALALLARSVMLLPHDRTQDQRDRESHPLAILSLPLAWIPPVLAVIVGGLQLSFWEHSTNGTPETLDLLLFATVVWSLLKFRHDEREGRLYFAGFVFAIGMANNYAMVGFFPLFIAALIWIRGFSFFNLTFLGRLLLCGLAGASLYLLMPILTGLSDASSQGFWQTLKINLVQQKQMLFSLPFNKSMLLHGPVGTDVDPLWVLALPSLLPLLFLAIRWPSHFGDTSKLGSLLTRWIFHLAHAFLLVICIWIAFDPPLSARHILAKYGWHAWFPMLNFHFLSALCIGYFAGYFLLVFRPVPARGRRTLPLIKTIHSAAVAGVALLLVLAPAGLLYRNLSLLRVVNGPMMADFAAALGGGLPKSGVLLSDDSSRLQVLQAWLVKHGRAGDFLPIDTQAFEFPAYHRYLHNRFPSKWTPTVDAGRTQPVSDTESANIILRLAKDAEITYLHPSFGFYFEYFHAEPHGLAQRLIKSQPGALLPPPLSPQLVAENEDFWNRTMERSLKPILSALTADAPRKKTGVVQGIFDRAHIRDEQNQEAKIIGLYYSRALNYWGVELQKKDEFEKAAQRFEQALQLNPDNVVAQINLDCNRNIRAGNRTPVDLSKAMNKDFLGQYRNWQQVMGINGPYDEPNLSYFQAYVFARGNNLRQAAQFFDRTRALAPDDMGSRLWLAQLHLMAGLPYKAADYTAEIHAKPDVFPIAGTNAISVMALDASILFAKKEPEKAIALIDSATSREPTNSLLGTAAAQIYAQHGHFDRAHAILDRQLQITPTDAVAQFNKAIIYATSTNYTEAIRLLDHLVTVHTNASLARLKRGDVYFQMGSPDKARNDYEAVLQQFPDSQEAALNLHELSFRDRDTNAALRYAAIYLSNAIPGSAQSQFIRTRVHELGGNLSPGEKSGMQPR